jgi:hypothetical protein
LVGDEQISKPTQFFDQLGATLGVTKGPVEVALNPSVSEEKDSVVGAMMKMWV